MDRGRSYQQNHSTNARLRSASPTAVRRANQRGQINTVVPEKELAKAWLNNTSIGNYSFQATVKAKTSTFTNKGNIRTVTADVIVTGYDTRYGPMVTHVDKILPGSITRETIRRPDGTLLSVKNF